MADHVQHIVLFRFPAELTADEEAEFYRQIRSWPEAIGKFLRLRAARDVSGRSRGYQYGLFSEFESTQALAEYQAHPVHQAFAAWVYERGCEVLAFDYAIPGASVVEA